MMKRCVMVSGLMLMTFVAACGPGTEQQEAYLENYSKRAPAR